MNLPVKKLIIISMVSSLVACATHKKDMEVGSYLSSQKRLLQDSSVGQLDATSSDSESSAKNFTILESFRTANQSISSSEDLTDKFSDTELVTITLDELPINDYLHHVMGEILGISYILGEEVESEDKTITLNIKGDISKRRLFTLSEALLAERGYVIRFSDEVFYIHTEKKGVTSGDTVYGYGNRIENIPETSSDILQIVPFDFGLQSNLQIVLRRISKAEITPNNELNAFLIRGKRNEVIKALEFIQLMDRPRLKNRLIGMYTTTFVPTDELTEKLPVLLKQEGITTGLEGITDKAVSMVALDRIGTIVFFANSKEVMERAAFWAKSIDQPTSGNETQYFIYQPSFARANDLGESLMPLISGSFQSGRNLTNSVSAEQQSQQNQQSRTAQSSQNLSAQSETMRMVVDERANSLIFESTGEEYKQLLPLIKRLDVMPKQVILEVIIAEVTLTDEFKRGVEFFFSDGNYSVSTEGALMGEGFGGLSYMFSNTTSRLKVNLFETNNLVNVISKPTLLVRDGVEASINVGNDIPTVGETISDPTNGQRSSVVYRKTGVELGVVPTINAQGVVIMEVDQRISNELEGGTSVSGSPSIFERSIKTEVVAESGQTIILGGLISENKTDGDTSVPFFSSIPLLGGLFEGKSLKGEKTELVVMITPRIIESSDEWKQIKAQFSNIYQEIKIN